MNAFKIGFIGLGLIGGSVAKSIHRISQTIRSSAMMSTPRP